MGARFEEDQIVIEPLFKLFFGKKIKILYEKIERIELPAGDSVFFHMKNGKLIKVPDPGIVTYYTGFGERLKKYRIPYKCTMEDSGDVSIEAVREEAARAKEVIVAYVNRSLKEKLGPEYELDVKIVERLVGTTLESRLLRNGIIHEEANGTTSIDEEPLVDEMDLAFLCEWDPVYDQGKYGFVEDVNDKAAFEKYAEEVILDNIYTVNASYNK